MISEAIYLVVKMKELAHKESAHSRTHLSSQVAKSRHQTTHFNFPSYENSRLPDDLSESSHTLMGHLFPCGPVHFFLYSMQGVGREHSREGYQDFMQPRLATKSKIFLLPPLKCQEYRCAPSNRAWTLAILEQGLIQVYVTPLTITLNPKCQSCKCVIYAHKSLPVFQNRASL